MVGVLYACSPVEFIRSFRPEHRDTLTRRLIEIEIFAVAAEFRGQGVGTTVLHHAERWLRSLGMQLILAKVDAADMQVLR